jgi:hypothetical protein
VHSLVPVLLSAAIVMVPLGAKAAGLVVWWQEGWCPEEGRAVAAFEQGTGKPVELLQSTTGMFRPWRRSNLPAFRDLLEARRHNDITEVLRWESR